MPMATPLGRYVAKRTRANRACRVAVSRDRNSAPYDLAGELVRTSVYPGRVVIVARDAVAARRAR